MMIEERQDVVILKGDKEKIEQLKSMHGLKRGEGICLLREDVPKVVMEEAEACRAKAERAEEAARTERAFYEERIRQLERDKAELTKEAEELRKTTLEAVTAREKAEERMYKLETAFIEASIK